MRHHPVLVLFIFSAVILIIDAYAFWGIRKISYDLSKWLKGIILFLYWIVPAGLILGMIVIFGFQEEMAGQRLSSYVYYLSGTFVVFYLPKLIYVIFNIFDDIIFQIRKLVTLKINSGKDEKAGQGTISRRKFLNQAGLVFAGVPFLSLIYGIAYGRFDFTTRHVDLLLPRLPDAFNGLKIVQISDFHLGSFEGHADQVAEIVRTVNEEKPDLILFTGDMVNNLASEMDSFMPLLSQFQAGIGKFSILGNHDYGEYYPWKSEEDRLNNLSRLIRFQEKIGFDLLMDEARTIEKDGDSLALIGIQNWGLPPFPQYGDLHKAMKGVDAQSLKILMSHDPTHWDAQVRGQTDIDWMLSGHTHGAQFGFEIPGMRWSPATIRYKQWGGLYTEGTQHLYVNTGLGSIGYPGRVGMPPEITVFQLKNGRIS